MQEFFLFLTGFLVVVMGLDIIANRGGPSNGDDE